MHHHTFSANDYFTSGYTDILFLGSLIHLRFGVI